MRHKRFLFLIFFLFFFLSSCIPTGTSGTGSGFTGGDLTIPGRCVKENSQIYISNERDYCFAYPYGFYIDSAEENDENTITLRKVLTAAVINFPDENAINDMADVAEAVANAAKEGDAVVSNPLTLKIYDEKIETGGYDLDEFIDRRINTRDELYRIPFKLSEDSILISTRNDTGNVLHVFTNHGDRYCHFSFMPSFIGINQENEEEYLLKLFLSIVETFTFIE